MFRLDLEILDNSRAAGHRFFLKEGEVLTIGRKDCDLVLSHPKISRRHLRISVLNGKPYAEDLGSDRGTSLNGYPLNQAMLISAGSALGVGPFLIRIVEFSAGESAPPEKWEPMEPLEEVPPARLILPLVGVRGLSLFTFFPFFTQFIGNPDAFWRGIPKVSGDLFIRSAFRHAWVAALIHFLVVASDGWVLAPKLLLGLFLFRGLGLIGLAFLLRWVLLPFMAVETTWEKAGGFVLAGSALWFPLTVATAVLGAGPWSNALSLILFGLGIALYSFGVFRAFHPEPGRFWALTALSLLCTALFTLTAIQSETRGRQLAGASIVDTKRAELQSPAY
jgi:hypothetical protein